MDQMNANKPLLVSKLPATIESKALKELQHAGLYVVQIAQFQLSLYI